MPSLSYHVCGRGRRGTWCGGMPSLPYQLLCTTVPWTTPGESSRTEGPGSRTVRWYSRAQRQTTTEIWLPLQFCSFIIAHGSSPSLPETVCAEPIVCCVMIGWNPSHADRACAPLYAPRWNGNPRPSHHTRAPVAGLDLYALNA